jgi:hypothetical protein
MKTLQFGCFLTALTILYIAAVAVPYPLVTREPMPAPKERTSKSASQANQARLEQAFLAILESPLRPIVKLLPQATDDFPTGSLPVDAAPAKQDFAYLADYAYAEVLPATKPADTVLDSLKDIPAGTPYEEIQHASKAFGLDVGFMEAVAKIESDFKPTERTGSYIGLFQLSNYEFAKFGSGVITNPRDNAVAAAYKFLVEEALFEIHSHVKPTLLDLYLIHQQGWQGAAEHVAEPSRVAWQSMCATDEGHQKGERWCKRAIWQNTLPSVKQIWKSVDNLTSGAFIDMWQQRLDKFYARYSQASAAQ